MPQNSFPEVFIEFCMLYDINKNPSTEVRRLDSKIYELLNFDHVGFMKLFKPKTRTYRHVIIQFCYLLLRLLGVSIIFDFYGTGVECEEADIQYIHCFVERRFTVYYNYSFVIKFIDREKEYCKHFHHFTMASRNSLPSLAGISNDETIQSPTAIVDIEYEAKQRPSMNGKSGLDYQSMASFDSHGGQHALLLKKYALFSATDSTPFSCCNGLLCRLICSNILQISLILYHLFRFGLAIYSYGYLQTLCIPFRLNILLGKLSTMSIYFFGLYTLRQEKLFYFIRKSFNPITTAKWIILIIAISVPYITGIIVACTVDYTSGDIPGFIYHLSIELSDVLRYWPSSAVVLLLYGFIDTFSFDIHGDNENKQKLYIFDNFDHVEFMQMFEAKTDKYRVVVGKFGWFIFVFFIVVVLLWVSLFISVIFDFYGKDCIYAEIEYVHYFAETMFYCLLWTSIIYKLHICHGKIQSYKYNFNVMVGINKTENAVQKLLINNYLDAMIEHRSPFALFGINPDTKTIVIVFSSVLLPLTTQTLHYIYNYDIV